MDAKQFKENLLLYGVDLNKWPEEIRRAGVEALQCSSEVQALLAEQEKFERILKTRKYEEPSSNLAQRIISLSLPQDKESPFGLGLFLSKLFSGEFFFSKPDLVLASTLTIATLMLGFVLGFSVLKGPMLTDGRQVNLQEFLHNEGNELWTKE